MQIAEVLIWPETIPSGMVWSIQQSFTAVWDDPLRIRSLCLKCSSSNRYIYLVVYVDDIVITGYDSDGIKALKQHLFQNFKNQDLGPLRYFLGIEVSSIKVRYCFLSEEVCSRYFGGDMSYRL